MTERPALNPADHQLRLTLTQHGIEAKVECLADPTNEHRDCTYYAAGVYPCTIDERCIVVDQCADLTLDEMLGTFDDTVEPDPIPVGWNVERDRGEGEVVIWPHDYVEHEAVHRWFELTYANYLVMPRSVLQSMPDEWQAKFVKLMEEAFEMFGGLPWPDYTVQARQGGRFIKDPIPHYNRGRTRIEPTPYVFGAAS